MTTGTKQYISMLARRFMFVCLVIAVLLVLRVAHPLLAQNMDESESDVPLAIQAMVKILLAESTDPAQRQLLAEALLKDPSAEQAQQALINILESDNNISAKIIICQAIAARPNPLLTTNSQRSPSPDFIDPLFKALLGDNPELSAVAAQALAKCRNGLAAKLSLIALNTSQAQSHRLAAISALTLLPGKKPILTLAELLDEKQPAPIRQRAAQILADTLLPTPPKNLDEFVQKFNQQYLPKIQDTDEKSFLLWQMDRIKQELDLARNDRDIQKEKSLQWFRRYEEQLTLEFNTKTQLDDRLTFVKSFLVDQPEPLLQIWALEQIRQWSSSEAVQTGPMCIQLVGLVGPFISDPNPQLRQLTADILALLAEQAKPSAPALMEQLAKEKYPLAQAALVQALGTFEYAAATGPALLLLGNSDHPDVVGQTARALGKIAASQTDPPETKQVEEIALALATNYSRFKEVPKVRLDFIMAMRKIATREQYLDLANHSFKNILTEALNDTSERIRSEAIYALAEILREKVLSVIMQPKNLLDDPDTAVRLAVIGVIQSYPDKKLLLPLQQRLPLEDNAEVVDLIVSAFGTILATQPTSDIYNWAIQLKQHTNNGSANKQELLCDQVVSLLSEKINQAKAAEQKYSIEHEILVLDHQADMALRKNQPAAAVSHLLALIKLQQASPKQSNPWRQRIVQIALETPQDETLLPLAQELRWDLLLADPETASLLGEIDQACQNNLATPDTAPHAARILIYLVFPLKDQIPKDSLPQWEHHRIQSALALIDSQEKLLADGETGQEDTKIIDLMGQLDPRLKDYPLSESLENRRAALAAFRSILQPPAMDTIDTPGTSGANEPNVPALTTD